MSRESKTEGGSGCIIIVFVIHRIFVFLAYTALSSAGLSILDSKNGGGMLSSRDPLRLEMRSPQDEIVILNCCVT